MRCVQEEEETAEEEEEEEAAEEEEEVVDTTSMLSIPFSFIFFFIFSLPAFLHNNVRTPVAIRRVHEAAG